MQYCKYNNRYIIWYIIIRIMRGRQCTYTRVISHAFRGNSNAFFLVVCVYRFIIILLSRCVKYNKRQFYSLYNLQHNNVYANQQPVPRSHIHIKIQYIIIYTDIFKRLTLHTSVQNFVYIFFLLVQRKRQCIKHTFLHVCTVLDTFCTDVILYYCIRLCAILYNIILYNE